MSNDLVTTLPISYIQPNPFQPRGKIQKAELEEMVESIKAVGVVEPIVVAHTPAGYQIIAGERRWRAAKLAGLTEIPVHVKKTTPKGMLEMAIVENLQRVDLSPIERGQAFQQLMRDFKFTAKQVSEKVGKSEPYVANTLRLLQLPDALKDGLVGNLITEGHARALMTIPDEKTMVDCYKLILKENATVRRTEELARRYRDELLSGESQPLVKVKGKSLHVDDAVAQKWQKSFESVFTTQSQFKVDRSSRKTKVVITLKGTPEQTSKDLEKILSWAELEK